MRGVWIYNSFVIWWLACFIGILLHLPVIVGLGFVAVGVWGITMTWIHTTNEDEAFEVRRTTRWYQRTFGWSWPFTLFQKELTRERHHDDFENYKRVGRIFGYPIGAVFVGFGVWMIVRATGG